MSNLKGKDFWIATPMYGGLCQAGYVSSLLHLIIAICQQGGRVHFDYIFNEALISRARNILSYRFVESGYSTLIFLDADIEFGVDGFLKMLELSGNNYPLIGGAYPMKKIEWDRVRGLPPEIDPSLVTGKFVFNTLTSDPQQASTGDPLEVTEVGCGMMVIDRSVFTRMAEEIPEIVYTPILGDKIAQPKAYAYFQDGIDRQSGYFLSEDYWFCRAWRKLGGKVHACPWIKSVHWGTYGFRGDIDAIFAAGLTV